MLCYMQANMSKPWRNGCRADGGESLGQVDEFGNLRWNLQLDRHPWSNFRLELKCLQVVYVVPSSVPPWLPHRRRTSCGKETQWLRRSWPHKYYQRRSTLIRARERANARLFGGKRLQAMVSAPKTMLTLCCIRLCFIENSFSRSDDPRCLDSSVSSILP